MDFLVVIIHIVYLILSVKEYNMFKQFTPFRWISPFILNSRARRCYQKAFDLDPASDEAGSALVDGLVADGEMVNLSLAIHRKYEAPIFLNIILH